MPFIATGVPVKIYMGIPSQQSLVILDEESSAQNLILYIQAIIGQKLPGHVNLVKFKLYEKNDSCAEWINGIL